MLPPGAPAAGPPSSQRGVRRFQPPLGLIPVQADQRRLGQCEVYPRLLRLPAERQESRSPSSHARSKRPAATSDSSSSSCTARSVLWSASTTGVKSLDGHAERAIVTRPFARDASSARRDRLVPQLRQLHGQTTPPSRRPRIGCLHRGQRRLGECTPLGRRRTLEHRVAHERMAKPHRVHPQLAVRLHQAGVRAGAQSRRDLTG